MGLDLDDIRARSAGPWQSVIVALIAELEDARRLERTAWEHAVAVREQAVREVAEAHHRTAALADAMEEARRLVAPAAAAVDTIDAALQHHWMDG
jgi:hypothetical protein